MKFQTMWFQSVFIVILGLACALAANAATLTTDPLTGLLIDPATDPNHFGNEPVKIPDTQICKSKMQANFYMIANAKIDAASAGMPRTCPTSTRFTSTWITVRKTSFTTMPAHYWCWF
jgi:hypothetical protein